jgi:hypothetical protein
MVVRCTRLALVLLGVSILDWCRLWRFLVSMLRVAYRKYASMRHQYKCNAWGAKSIMLHDHEHVNPYKPFTNLPLAFLMFEQFNYGLEV